ncbi:MAG: galactoside O-acetyltransferase [Faecalicatena sp.]|uniref:DapH/DapD/GlmU-related protein n=1 Tax=Faecalicatena sp. TaxID=2005360 RepID=UPI00258D6FD7|nr:DapH/DapD/GlmU-related protein [Faecalicatena sp.]MCI6467572.1 galactoside O-acetyltransferase [Faecalicatena sp.]MDY5619749.1 DapH/DapD/GlmU-related protein [Lachnospiraceae bacterium]
MTMRERIMQGKLFTDECEGLPEEQLAAKKRMKAFNSLEPDEMEKRISQQNEIFGRETKAWIEPPFYFCYGTHITIGDGTYINMNCNFVDDGLIQIGEHVLFGPAVTIATVGHPVNPHMREYMYTDPVKIEDNCWIGANVTICPGVTIGKNSVIGAGSVVIHDIPENSVAAGNPCKVIRAIGEKDSVYYYKDRKIEPEDLLEEKALRN